MVRGSGEEVMVIDRPQWGLLASMRADGVSLEIGELLGEKVWGSQIGPRLRPKLNVWRL